MSATRFRQFSPPRQRLLFALLTFSSLTSGGAALAAGSLPTGGHFVGGAGAITTNGNGLTVNQTSQTGIINWQSFSIGKGNAVNINNGTGATLNRVTGGNISTIAGSLKATGSVYVVNSAGVMVTPTGKVVTMGSFVASTRDVSNSAFMAGGTVDLHGNSAGTVVNQGSITSTNGDVVLVGKSVTNSGSINAAKGTAALAAGDDVLLQASGDDAVLVKAGSGDVTNTGTVAAAQAELDAAGGNVYALATNNGGIIRATGTTTKDGHVYLSAGDDLTVSGSVTASNADGSGGTIVATGKAVDVGANAKITADGAAGNGGTILVGGEGHLGARAAAANLPTAPVAAASTTHVAAGAQISANAGANGNGGNVIVWSDLSTDYTGMISAKGGTASGHGGFVEVSGKDRLGFTGKVTTMAAHGAAGTLLLDPQDVTIYASTDTNIATFINTSASSFILNTDLDTMLANNNVTISTSGGTGGSGDIHFGTNGNAFTNAAPVFWSSNNSLTLNADRLIDTPGGNPNATTGGHNTNTGAAGILINSRGSGSINFNAAGTGLTSAATVITLTGDVVGNGGAINFTSTGASYRIEVGNNVSITNTAANGAGTITFQADQVRFGTGTGPVANITTPGEVDILPTTPGAVQIGDIDPNGQFANNDNTTLFRSEDVISVHSNLLVIGSTATTSISLVTVDPVGELVNGINTFDASFVHNLKFLTGTGGSVTQDANTPIVVNDPSQGFAVGSGGLAVQTGGAITLNNPYNSVGTIAFKQTGAGGAISFTKQGDENFGGTALTVGTVADISGITTAGTNTVTLSVNETNVNSVTGQSVGAQQVLQSTGAANAITAAKLDLETNSGLSSFALDNTSNAFTDVAANAGSVSLHDNIALTTATVGSSSGITAGNGDVTIVDNGKLTIGSGAGISAFGNIKVEDQTFTNSDAGSAFTLTGTSKTWRVYSQDPTLDSDNGASLTYSFVQYNAANSYADPFTTANAALDSGISATSNGFIYSVAPVLKESVSGTFNKVYDGTTAVTGTLTAGNYTPTVGFTGINGDVISYTNPTGTGAGVATYAMSNVGNNIVITLTTAPTASAVDAAKGVTVFGYQFTPTITLKGNITPLGVTVSGMRVYDGATDAAGSILTVSGEIAGDPTLTVTGSGVLASKNANVTPTNISTLTGLTLSGTGASNYMITSGTVLVTPLDVTVSGTRVYDQSTTASGTILSVDGKFSGDIVTVTGGGTLASKNANVTPTNISTLGTLGLTGTDAGNYHLVSGTVLVTPLGLTVSGTRAYNGSTTASSGILTASGVLAGDGTITVTGSGVLASKNANATATNISNLTGLGLTGTNAGNYTIASGTVLVTPVNLTITADDASKTYGQTKTFAGTEFTTGTGLVGSETVTSVSLSSTGAPATADAGSYNIVGSAAVGSSGFLASNYNITYVPGTLTVNKAALTITASDQFKTYGSVKNLGSTLFTTGAGQLKNGDTITAVTLASALGTPATADVGGYTINVSGGTGAQFKASNYAITYVTGTLTVNPAALTINIGDQSKTYGQTANLGTTGFTTGAGQLKNGDTVTSVTLASAGAGSGANVGGYSITGTNAAGTLTASNYTITYNPGTLTVNPAVLNVTPVAVTRTYDGSTLNNTTYSDNTGNYTITGFVNGQNLTTAGIGLTGSMAFDGSTSTAVKNAATYSQGAGTLALTSNHGNYTLNFTNPHPNNYVITPASVTIAMLAGTRVYDGMTDAFGSILGLTNLVAGDHVTLSGEGTLAGKNVGRETITNLGTLALQGTDAGNYTLTGATGYVDVTKATLTVSAVTQTRVYDGTVTSINTPTVAGLQTGDSIIGTLMQTYGSKNVLGTNGSTLAAAHDISVSDTNGGGNYNIVYKTAKGTITPFAVNLVGTRVYDGLKDGDSGILSVTDPFGSDTVTVVSGTSTIANKNVGPEAITNFGTLKLGGADAGNYTLAGATGTVTVTPLAIIATGTRVYNGTTGVDGSILTVTNAPTGDDIGLTGTGTSGSKHVGTHDVTGPGTLALTGSDAGNYTLVGGKETVKITPFSVVLFGTRVYDGATDGDSGILAVTNAFAGDTVDVASGTSTIVSRNVGNENITDFGTLTLGGASSGDYTLVGARGIVKVTPELLTVTAVPGTKTYDGTTTSTGTPIVTTGTIFGPDTGNFIQTYGSPHAGHNITLTPSGTVNDGNGGNNYIVTYVPITTGVIDPRPVILTGTRVIDNQTDAGSPILTITNLVGNDMVTVSGNGVLKAPNVGPEPIIDFTGLTLGGTSSGDYTLVGAIGTVTITPINDAPPTINIPNTQTASGNGTTADFTAYDGGLITLEPRQNGIVTGTIATIDGTDYHPDSQLGCTLGQAGCLQNGVAPTTTGTPPQ